MEINAQKRGNVEFESGYWSYNATASNCKSHYTVYI